MSSNTTTAGAGPDPDHNRPMRRKPPSTPPPDPSFKDENKLILSLILKSLSSDDPDVANIQSHNLPKRLRELAAILAGVDSSTNGLIELLAHLIKQHITDDFKRENYLTNDIITIRGSFRKLGSHTLIANGTQISLDRREFVLLKVLHGHAVKHYKKRSKLGTPGDPFMSVKKILVQIDVLKEARRELDDVWNDSIYTSMHRVVSDLRVKLVKARLNPHLIESGPAGAGYRISTLLGNMTIELDA